MRWNQKFRKFKDQKVDITIKDQTYKGQILKYAGTNSFDQNVLTTAGSRGLFYIDSWKDVKIVDFADERIFKD